MIDPISFMLGFFACFVMLMFVALCAVGIRPPPPPPLPEIPDPPPYNLDKKRTRVE